MLLSEFKVNKFLTLKVDKGKTIIYVDNKPFTQCKYLLLQIHKNNFNELYNINSIDEISEKLSRISEHYDRFENMQAIDPKTEFWAHCSNLQAWYENEYDTSLLHSNIAFPLLKKLTEVGDSMARKVFKEEILLRLESEYPEVIIFLINENYIDYLKREDFLLSVLNEEDAFAILEIEKLLKIKLSAVYEDSGFINKNAFMFDHKKVFGLKIFDLDVNHAFKHIKKLKHLYSLTLNGCNLTRLPIIIENLKNLRELDLSDNKLKVVPKEIKSLLSLQILNLRANGISDIQNLVEIAKSLRRLMYVDLSLNKIESIPNYLKQIDSHIKIKIK